MHSQAPPSQHLSDLSDVHTLLGRNAGGMAHTFGLSLQEGRFWRERSVTAIRLKRLQTLVMLSENSGLPTLMEAMKNCPSWAEGCKRLCAT